MNGFSRYWRYARLHIKEFRAYSGWPMTMLSALMFVSLLVLLLIVNRRTAESK